MELEQTAGNLELEEEDMEMMKKKPPKELEANNLLWMNGCNYLWPPIMRESVVRYKECRKNHAANIGGYAVDGCREFMPAGEEGTTDAFKCAACTCHRNFHRREITHNSYYDCCTYSDRDCSSKTTTPR